LRLRYEDRPYRPCVGVMLLNREGRVFAGQRIDQVAEAWQMPQGGIDEGESALEAAIREACEEIGSDKFELLAESSVWRPYDLPEVVADQVWRGRFRGQTQKWFAFRFTGGDGDIAIAAVAEPEFCEWRWLTPDELMALIVPFKRDIYRDVFEEFRRLLD
jgi:putative (di)nucleoside polyphosphate hydrolase